jgi:flagellar basal body rod protein FlgG
VTPRWVVFAWSASTAPTSFCRKARHCWPQAALTLGSVEESNATAVSAMTELVTATRTFEAFQRVIDAFREADRKVVTTVPA